MKLYLAGKWLDLDDYADEEEFYDACRELHADEDDPEIMFQDVDSENEWERALYNESSIPAEYWEIRAALDGSNIDDDIFSVYVEETGETPTCELIRECEDRYVGHYDGWHPGADYAEEMAENMGEKIPEFIAYHINWEGVWHDLEMDGYFEKNGYIFCAA